MTTDTVSSSSRSKLPMLPQNARVQKRPLHRPAVPSAYTSSDEKKVVYVSVKTPFMSAVKRVDKLLRLAEKRGLQSATATVRSKNPRKRARDDDKLDEINNIAQTLHDRTDKEEVVVKGTGKAIVRALEVGTWFQQRPQYAVRLRTSTTDSIDDIEIDASNAFQSTAREEAHTSSDSKIIDDGLPRSAETDPRPAKLSWFDMPEQKDETRVRSVSVIEVYITMK